MQVVAAAAMEAPAGGDADDAQGRAGRALPRDRRRPTRRTTCAASTTATATIDGVAPDSTTETYAALRLEIDNWRWSGVPFFIRTGKRLPVDADRAAARLQARRRGSASAARGTRPEPNQLVVKLDPSTGVRLDRRRPPRRRGRTPAPIDARHGVRRGGRRGRRPRTRCCCTPRWSGDSTRFTRQDGVEETWRIMQPLLDAPPPVHAVRAGHLGPEGGRRAGRRARPLARAVDRVVTHGAVRRTEPAAAERRRAVAVPADRRLRVPLRTATPARSSRPTARSTGCACPRFDSPSVFGSLLDREAGVFRFGPFGINHPRPRAATSRARTSLVTTWKTPTGWVVVRDALTMGPREREDTVTPHTRPPADDDADHMLVRTVECIDGPVEVELVCEPVFDYGRDAGASGRSSTATGTPPTRPAPGTTIRLRTDLALGIEGEPRPRRATCCDAGRAALLRALLGGGARGAAGRRRGRRADRRDDALLARLARRGARIPDHRWRDPIQRSALAIKGLTYMPTGATVAALTTSLPETPGGERNWDYRYTWMRDTTFTLQALHCAQPRLGGRRVHAVRRRPRAERGRRAADHVRDRRRARPDRVDARRPVRLRGRQPGADRQRRLRPAPERRLRRRARLDPAPHAHAASGCRGGCGRSSQAQAECATKVWREPDQGIWEARGEPQHYVSSKLMCWVALDRARASWPRSAATRSWPPSGRAIADEIRADILEHGVDERGVLRQHYDTDALDASTLLAAIFGFLPGDDERLRATRAGDRRRADRERLRPALPHRRDRRRPLAARRARS